MLLDGVYIESVVVTHMTTDVDKIALRMMNMSEVWLTSLKSPSEFGF